MTPLIAAIRIKGDADERFGRMPAVIVEVVVVDVVEGVVEVLVVPDTVEKSGREVLLQPKLVAALVISAIFTKSGNAKVAKRSAAVVAGPRASR